MRTWFRSLLLVTSFSVIACAPTTPAPGQRIDNAVLWVQYAAEYRAVSAQAYAEASRDLAGFLADKSWSALPGVAGDAGKPPAIILDVDETVVSNYDFQINHLPYTSHKHYTWSRDNRAVPVPGAVEFIAEATAAGVEVFYVTNRPCEKSPDSNDRCPQKHVTLQDLLEAGFQTDLDHVLLAYEQDGWGKEKISRRRHIAATHRVIMLFGDDFGDFVFCARAKPSAPCTVAATRASRHGAVTTYANYWGQGWYILPNPMHGSWTSFP